MQFKSVQCQFGSIQIFFKTTVMLLV